MHRNIIPSYSEQGATFLDLFISKDALHVSSSSSARHQEMVLSSISSTVAASNSIGWQYLKLFVQFCAPDDGRRNRLKHVECL